MPLVLPATAGVVLAAVLLAAVSRLDADGRRRVLALGLSVAAGVYAGFAIVAETGLWIWVELFATLSFSLLAALASRWASVLAVG